MNFMKFYILSTREGHPLDDNKVPVLLNLDHIISIKRIKIQEREQYIDGYWIRLTNGKKYRAVKIPAALDKALGKHDGAPVAIADEDDHSEEFFT